MQDAPLTPLEVELLWRQLAADERGNALLLRPFEGIDTGIDTGINTGSDSNTRRSRLAAAPPPLFDIRGLALDAFGASSSTSTSGSTSTTRPPATTPPSPAPPSPAETLRLNGGRKRRANASANEADFDSDSFLTWDFRDSKTLAAAGDPAALLFGAGCFAGDQWQQPQLQAQPAFSQPASASAYSAALSSGNPFSFDFSMPLDFESEMESELASDSAVNQLDFDTLLSQMTSPHLQQQQLQEETSLFDIRNVQRPPSPSRSSFGGGLATATSSAAAQSALKFRPEVSTTSAFSFFPPPVPPPPFGFNFGGTTTTTTTTTTLPPSNHHIHRRSSAADMMLNKTIKDPGKSAGTNTSTRRRRTSPRLSSALKGSMSSSSSITSLDYSVFSGSSSGAGGGGSSLGESSPDMMTTDDEELELRRMVSEFSMLPNNIDIEPSSLSTVDTTAALDFNSFLNYNMNEAGYYPFQFGSSSAGMNPFLIDSGRTDMMGILTDDSPLLRNSEMIVGTPTLSNLNFQQFMDSANINFSQQDFNSSPVKIENIDVSLLEASSSAPPLAGNAKPKKPRSLPKNPRKRPTSSREMSATPKPEDFQNESDGDDFAVGGGGPSHLGSSIINRNKKSTTSSQVPGTVNRRAVKEPIKCITCNSPIAILELRGTVVGIEYHPDVNCINCQPQLTTTSSTSASSSKGGGSSAKQNKSAASNKGKKKRTATTAASASTTTSTSAHILATVSTCIYHTFPCLVCKVILGQGTINETTTPTLSPTSTASLKSTAKSTTASMVCIPCDTKYLFCSECGGGGKQRTGKYRPRGLFPNGRKTCSLPHVRIGTAEVLYRVYDCSAVVEAVAGAGNIASGGGSGGGGGGGGGAKCGRQVLEGIRDVLFDCHVGLYAVPGVLDGFDGEEVEGFFGNGEGGGGGGGGGLDGVFMGVKKVWEECVYNVLIRGNSGGGGGGATTAALTSSGVSRKLYLTTAWIEKMYRMKSKTVVGKKKKESSSSVGGSAAAAAAASSAIGGIVGGSWMSKLDSLDPSVCAPLGFGDDVIKLESCFSNHGVGVVDDDDLDEEPLDFGEDRTFVSFSVVEWNQQTGSLFIYQMTPRTVNQTNVDSYRDSLRQTIQQIESDPSYSKYPPLKHIWCWTPKVMHSKLKGIPEWMGFVPIDQYLKEKGNRGVVSRDEFMVDDFAPVQEDGVVVYACSVKNIIQ
ncbi:hypothetical protein BDR26DRAFT_1005922 [Obelidium mucronatum]|nr:hypothetical protein BDR26DRAFT_1005922 [Obelidium mucronatum]